MAKRHHHLTKHDREMDRKNLKHARAAHESKHEAHEHEHKGMERYERGPVKHHKKDPRHITEHDREQDRENLKHAHHAGHHAEHHSHHMHEEHYAGMEPRRRREMEDAGMIHEDHGAIANLPQEMMIKLWPNGGSYMPEPLDDTIEGIDKQMDYDDRQRSRNYYPKKV